MDKNSDAIFIPGDYQEVAATQGPAAQRFWHYSKRMIIDRCLPPAMDDIVLDAGCGSGVISAYLSGKSRRVIGLDASADAIAFARRRFARANLSFIQALIDQPPAENISADKIYCLEVIEHIYPEQARRMLALWHTLLRPNGRILLTTPNSRSVWPLIEWLMDHLRLAPPMAGDQHVARYSPRALAAMCEGAGFSIVQMTSVCHIAPWLAWIDWQLAERVCRRELDRRGLWGPILAAVLKRTCDHN